MIRKLMIAIALLCAATLPARAESLLEKLGKEPTYATFMAAVKAAGVEDVLKQANITVFIPNDAAFKRLPDGALANLMKPENKAQLVQLVRNHVVARPLPTKEIDGKEFSVQSLAGKSLAVDADDGLDDIKVNKIKVVKWDVMGDNGVGHEIGRVLLP